MTASNGKGRAFRTVNVDLAAPDINITTVEFSLPLSGCTLARKAVMSIKISIKP